MPREETFFDQLTRGIGEAVTDIREKCVEEPMWGRVVNEREASAPQWPEAREVQPEPEQSREHGPEVDIDR
jgi:hypothetical protein